jgi:MYXO-CTERM domain-containing protein
MIGRGETSAKMPLVRWVRAAGVALALGLGGIPATAFADALPACEEGQEMVCGEGSDGHHGGCECVAPDSEGGCASSSRFGGGAWLGAAAVLMALAVLRRR